jgi:hypothetical protein
MYHTVFFGGIENQTSKIPRLCCVSFSSFSAKALLWREKKARTVGEETETVKRRLVWYWEWLIVENPIVIVCQILTLAWAFAQMQGDELEGLPQVADESPEATWLLLALLRGWHDLDEKISRWNVVFLFLLMRLVDVLTARSALVVSFALVPKSLAQFLLINTGD